MYVSKCKKRHVCQKGYFWNPGCSCQSGKYLASIMDDSVIKTNLSQIMKKRKHFQQISMNKNITYKTQSFFILLTFLSITIALLLIAVSVYCYLIKY